ncbi:helix-turn-helix transcriptional regulator [Natronomonas salina]|uniref:helix-turn-helix transcriptional regulator n=1 Tax=Natronomonas salina TaxID=1710540 RepID=UPI001FE80528|nr:helix-turn-helix domain-containing protein [Natronomonas salina]
MTDDDVARFLADSPDRRRVLTRLADEPGTPAELASALPLSRRSVQRHLGQFADRDWVAKRDGAYHLTTTGELVVAEHTAYLEALQGIDDHGDVYRHLPDADHAPDPRWLDDATVTRASTEAPQAPVHSYLDSVRDFETDRVRMISPVLSRLFHDVHADLALEGTHTELVLSAATIDRARELNPTEFEIVVSVGVLDLYRHPDDVAFRTHARRRPRPAGRLRRRGAAAGLHRVDCSRVLPVGRGAVRAVPRRVRTGRPATVAAVRPRLRGVTTANLGIPRRGGRSDNGWHSGRQLS